MDSGEAYQWWIILCAGSQFSLGLLLQIKFIRPYPRRTKMALGFGLYFFRTMCLNFSFFQVFCLLLGHSFIVSFSFLALWFVLFCLFIFLALLGFFGSADSYLGNILVRYGGKTLGFVAQWNQVCFVCLTDHVLSPIWMPRGVLWEDAECVMLFGLFDSISTKS